MDWLYVIILSITILFIPGLIWSYLFFDRGKIEVVERMIISPALSVVILVFTYSVLNYAFEIPNVPLGFLSVLLVESVLGLCLVFLFTDQASSTIKNFISKCTNKNKTK